MSQELDWYYLTFRWQNKYMKGESETSCQSNPPSSAYILYFAFYIINTWKIQTFSLLQDGEAVGWKTSPRKSCVLQLLFFMWVLGGCLGSHIIYLSLTFFPNQILLTHLVSSAHARTSPQFSLDIDCITWPHLIKLPTKTRIYNDFHMCLCGNSGDRRVGGRARRNKCPVKHLSHSGPPLDEWHICFFSGQWQEELPYFLASLDL